MLSALALLALALPAPPAEFGADPADARAFRIEPACVRAFWLQADRHRRDMGPVVAGGWNNPPEVVAAWEAECAGGPGAGTCSTTCCTATTSRPARSCGA
jgi:hypothetical protein